MDAGNEEIDGGPPTCAELDCDDGIECTVDRCEDAMCMREVDHAACGAGSYCDATLGCVGGTACASDEDCPPSPGGCFGPARCVPDTRTCTYSVLDGDLDGHGPPVCGGMDCNDADPSIHPGAADDCDGVDDDCSGTPDSPLAPRSCRDDQICAAGACGCSPSETECGGSCLDTSSDPQNCGGCGMRCSANETCVAGECACEAPYASCGFGRCVDRDVDEDHCGVCGLRCIPGAECVAGACQCAPAETACSDGCAPLGTVDDCLSCGDSCGPGSICTAIGCSPRFPWLTAYGTHVDDSNQAGNQSLAIAPDGGIVYAGNYFDPLYPAYPTSGSTPVVSTGTIVVSKHDAAGVRLWMHRWARGATTGTYSVVDTEVGADGSVYVLLEGSRNLLLHDGQTLTGGTTIQTLVVALDGAGNYRWHRFSTGFARPYDLELAGSELTIAGEGGSGGFGGGAPTGTGPGFVATLDSTGAHVASFLVPVLPRFVARSGGALWIAATFRDTVTLGSISLTAIGTTFDIVVAQLTTTGEVTSAFRFGLGSSDEVHALALLSGGDLLLSTNSSPLIRMTPTGTVVWFESGATPYETVAVDSADRIYAARRFGTVRTLRRVGADGSTQLEVPVTAYSLELDVRGAEVAIGGTWERSIDVGAHHVRSSTSTFVDPAGFWISPVEVP